MAIPPLIPIIKSELGITNAQAGLLMTSLLLPYALIQVPAGYFGDRLGRKKLVVISILGYSLASSFMILAKEYWQLLSVRALYGIFAGLYYAPSTALISDIFREKKGSALGIFMIGPPIGTAIAPLIVIPIALTFEWRISFVVLSLMSALIGLSLLFAIKGEVHEVEGPKFHIPKHIFTLSISNFLALMAFFGMLTFLPDFLVSKGENISKASFYFSILSVIGIAGSIFGGIFYDKLKRTSIFIVLAFNAILSFILIRFTLLVIMPLLGLFFYSVGPIITAYTAELANNENKGSVMGFVNMMGFFGATAGPYLIGLLIDMLSYEKALYTIPLLYIISAIILTTEKKNKISHT
jgi:predicted MFS family arabinose efflux permease